MAKKRTIKRLKPQPITISRIVLPLPHKYLSPNARCHWGAKARQVKKHRGYAKLASKKVHRPKVPWERATLRITFFHKTRRDRDPDNAEGSCKAYIDGVVDAGLIAGDSFRHLRIEPVEFAIDKLDPRVEMEFERVESEPDGR